MSFVDDIKVIIRRALAWTTQHIREPVESLLRRFGYTVSVDLRARVRVFNAATADGVPVFERELDVGTVVLGVQPQGPVRGNGEGEGGSEGEGGCGEGEGRERGEGEGGEVEGGEA
ncbi:hypothetical protein EI94DRAFT_1707240 [Lactarius quietus]|nr:hypothetical protein EI94DRAFT_1707240 [Lactarius quietus]